MKIKIGMPVANLDNIKPETKSSINDLDTSIYDFKTCISSDIIRSRNALVNNNGPHLIYQSNFDFEWFLNLDSDIAFKSQNIDRLIHSGHKIISGIYQYKNDRKLAVAGMFDNGITTSKVNWENTGIHQVDWTGAGFLLIHRDVFCKLEYPWFRSEIVKQKIQGQMCQQVTGEDIGLALNCKRHNINIYVDCDCKVQHI